MFGTIFMPIQQPKTSQFATAWPGFFLCIGHFDIDLGKMRTFDRGLPEGEKQKYPEML